MTLPMAARSWMSLVQSSKPAYAYSLATTLLQPKLVSIPGGPLVESEERDASAAYWRWLSSMVVSARFPVIFLHLGVSAADGIVCTIHQKVEVWVRLDDKLRPGRSLFADSEYTGGLG